MAACSSTSQVAELAPDLFGLTAHANTAAAAARIGVDQARAYCTAQDRSFQPTRTEIGNRDYTIAFRCPRVEPGTLPSTVGLVPALAELPSLPAAQPAIETQSVATPAPRRQSARRRGTARRESPGSGFPDGTQTF